MSEKIAPYSRGKQVLRILAEHGPLTSRGLSSILLPKISERRLREALSRLKQKGLITDNHDRIFRGSAKYYRLTRNAALLEKLAADPKIGILRSQPYLREREHLHSETCAIWAETLRRMYPHAEVIREHHFANHALLRRILLNDGRDSDTRPDLVLILSSKVAIAIEIERNRKSAKRLVKKLHRYASQSRFDGVLYLCSAADLADTLRSVYASKVRQNALRVGPYSGNFLVFGELTVPDSITTFALRNANNEPLDMASWIAALLANPTRARRDTHFKLPAATGWSASQT